jgi:hypothetical protein
LLGVKPQPDGSCTEISREQLLRWQKGNDMWAMVLLSPLATPDTYAEQYLTQGIPATIQEVILEFDGGF